MGNTDMDVNFESDFYWAVEEVTDSAIYLAITSASAVGSTVDIDWDVNSVIRRKIYD